MTKAIANYFESVYAKQDNQDEFAIIVFNNTTSTLFEFTLLND